MKLHYYSQLEGSLRSLFLLINAGGIAVRHRLALLIVVGLAVMGTGSALAQSTDATLADFQPSAGNLSPDFAPDVFAYTSTVSAATKSITIYPTPSEAGATIKVNGLAIAPGGESGAITLNVGLNTITTEVTAPDGLTKKSYVLRVTVLSLTVTTNANAGIGSLRQALANAALAPGPDVIVLPSAMSGKVITLETELGVSDSEGITLDASSLPAGLTISGNDTVRAFNISPGARLTLAGLTLRSGVSGSGNGGAILNAGDLNITGCTLSGNGAVNGGGIYSTGTLNVTRCTFAGNVANANGGALWSNATTIATNCTLSTNRADDGAGVFSASGVTRVERCIVSGNTTIDGLSDNELSGSIVANLSVVGGDARLSSLGNHGGPTQTFALLAGSPARDSAPSNETVDQRGFPIQDSFPDAGAFEAQLSLIEDQSILQNGTTGPVEFTVGNIGPAGTLTATSSNLTVVPANKVVLAGSGATRTVSVTPLAGKYGTTTITISDALHGDSVSFDVEVRGFGVFVFSQTGYSVSEGGKAILEIRRTLGSGGTATVNVATSTGSVAPSATAGNDYDAFSDTLTFLDGEESKTIEIKTHEDLLIEGNESVLVKMTLPSGSTATLGTPSSCTLMIIDPSAVLPDPNGLPSVNITSPATNAVVGVVNGGTATIRGTAADQNGVAKVEAHVIAPVAATTNLVTAVLGSPGGKSTAYAVDVVTPTGPTTVEVIVTDFAGNSKSTTRVFNVSRPLQVNTVGLGTVSAGFLGASFREVGKSYTITATAGLRSFFAGWDVSDVTGTGITPLMMSGRTLTFTFTEGLVLTAKFTGSPFNGTLVGAFAGLVKPSSTEPAPNGTAANNSSVGMLTGTVTAIGTFSGRLSIDGTGFMLIGTIDINGIARVGATSAPVFVFKRTGKADIEVALQLDMSGISGQITGTVTQRLGGIVQAVSYATLYRAHFGGLSRVPVEIAGTSSQRYNILLQPQATQVGLTSSQFPQGTGVGAITVTNTGMVVLTGSLPDGTACSSSMPLSRVFTCALFSNLYLSKGCFAAALSIDLSKPETDITGLNSFWVRPAQPTASGYRSGWPAGIVADVIGSKYVIPTGSTPVLPGLGAVNATLGNATLNFTSGRLTTPISLGVNISPTGMFSPLPGTPVGTTLSLIRPMGQVAGRFINNDGKATNYSATTLQKPGAWQGVRGYFLSLPTVPADGLVESGNVTLVPR